MWQIIEGMVTLSIITAGPGPHSQQEADNQQLLTPQTLARRNGGKPCPGEGGQECHETLCWRRQLGMAGNPVLEKAARNVMKPCLGGGG